MTHLWIRYQTEFLKEKLLEHSNQTLLITKPSGILPKLTSFQEFTKYSPGQFQRCPIHPKICHQCLTYVNESLPRLMFNMRRCISKVLFTKFPLSRLCLSCPQYTPGLSPAAGVAWIENLKKSYVSMVKWDKQTKYKEMICSRWLPHRCKRVKKNILRLHLFV